MSQVILIDVRSSDRGDLVENQLPQTKNLIRIFWIYEKFYFSGNNIGQYTFPVTYISKRRNLPGLEHYSIDISKWCYLMNYLLTYNILRISLFLIINY